MRIAFTGDDSNFLLPIIRNLEERGHRVKMFPAQSEVDLERAMRWADVTWVEWMTDVAVAISRMQKQSKVVVRCHRYEVFGHWPSSMKWDGVSGFIFVNKSIQDSLVRRLTRDIDNPSVVVIPNMVEESRFKFNPKKFSSDGPVKIALSGYINSKKGIPLFMFCVKKMRDVGIPLEPTIVGTAQDAMVIEYANHVNEAHDLGIKFRPWTDDVPALYREMDCVISSSMTESFHYSIPEGVMSGCFPFVHDWPGSNIWPDEWKFFTPDDFHAKWIEYSKTGNNEIVKGMRDFVIKQCGEKVIGDRIEKYLTAIVEERGSEYAGHAGGTDAIREDDLVSSSYRGAEEVVPVAVE